MTRTVGNAPRTPSGATEETVALGAVGRTVALGAVETTVALGAVQNTVALTVVPPASRRRVALLLSWPALVAAAAAGILVVGLSYRLSAGGSNPHLYYGVFWAGMLLAVLPVAARIGARSSTRAQRAWGVALLAVLTYVPKYLRNPFAPAYHDEHAHWREALDVLATGQLLRPNALIPIVEFFPGTSGLTAVVHLLTGLSVWSSGVLVLFVSHVLLFLGVFVLAEVHLRSHAAGGIAALVYGLNPSSVYFDTQYAYEGIAIAFFMWVLALTSLAAVSAGRRRIALVAAALVCAGGSIVTHHLTTFFLLLLLGAVSVLVTVRSALLRRGGATGPAAGGTSARVWWSVTGGTALLATAWLVLVAWPTVSYLSPYVGGSVDQLSAVAARSSDEGRVLLAPTVQPLWERAMTALSPVVMGLICLLAFLLVLREHQRWRTGTLALMAYGFVYFPSVLFLVAPSGAEGARRSWAFTYVGLALVVAFVAARLRSSSVSVGRWRVPVWTRSPAVMLVVVAILLVGNVGGGLNDPYRFPGPFRWGTDTNSASDEARTVAARLAAEAGDPRVVTDRYTAMQLVAYGGIRVAAPSVGFPAWELTESPDDPSLSLAGMLYTSGYEYLVVDVRMTEEPSFIGDNYGPNDPLLGEVVPRENVDRLDAVAWASRVMSTEHLRVYRLNLDLLGRTLEGGS